MGWGWLWRRRRAGPPPREVILYTRPGCHLCEAAHEILEQARRRHHFLLREVDIDGDPELVRRYGLSLPVVTAGGRVYFRGAVNAVLLERVLRGEAATGPKR